MPTPSFEEMSVPNFTVNSGVPIPAVGLGVFQIPPDETIAAVKAALQVGYRHVETARRATSRSRRREQNS